MKRYLSSTLALVASIFLLALLSGCASSSGQRSGGYYKDDGPMAHSGRSIANIPDATPRIEPFAQANLRPYKVLGMSFVPIRDSQPFSQTGTASWYGKKFHGRQTANGERYDMFAMTAAHPTLPLPSYARVTRLDNNKSIIVRINDRGPFHSSRIIDLSYAAAAKLDMVGPGKATVRVEAITHEDIRTGRYQTPTGTQLAHDSADEPKPKAQPAVYTMEKDPLSEFLAQREKQPPAAHAQARTSNQRKDGFFLQFGAFRSADRAEQLHQEVNNRLSSDYADDLHINNHHEYFRVRLGPFNSRTEAANAAHQIQQITGQNTQITYED